MFCIPVITEADFPTLKSILRPPMPDSYDAWLALCSRWERENRAKGVAHVEVNSQAFAEYMSGAGRALDVQALLDYVAFNPWRDPD